VKGHNPQHAEKVKKRVRDTIKREKAREVGGVLCSGFNGKEEKDINKVL